MRGQFPEHDDPEGRYGDGYAGDDDTDREMPPAVIGQDERRMQVRAYNFWASLLSGRNFPAIGDLEPDTLGDFGPYSVLLDFRGGLENPVIAWLGDVLAGECGAHGEIDSLADVPTRSLLSRITDHYMQILANQAPIGFEAEFINQRGATILYRGILLPFSSDDVTIDYIYGVINWKELADQQTSDALLQQIDDALEPRAAPRRESAPITEWADGPVELGAWSEQDDPFAEPRIEFPAPNFGADAPLDLGPELIEPDPDTMGLGDWLALARELAEVARGSEDRSRAALYAAIGRAYDFALAAMEEPEDFRELVEDAGLAVQERAPLTPLVKLVFGADYDKTRLTEFATVIGHAQRIGLARGTLAEHIAAAPGGLKGLVREERCLRRAEAGRDRPREDRHERLLRALREAPTQPLSAVAPQGEEFTLLVARRTPDGQLLLVGEVAQDTALLDRAARHLVG